MLATEREARGWKRTDVVGREAERGGGEQAVNAVGWHAAPGPGTLTAADPLPADSSLFILEICMVLFMKIFLPISEARETVHVVFKYLSRSLLQNRVEEGGPTHPHHISQLFCRFVIQRRRNRYSPSRCFPRGSIYLDWTEDYGVAAKHLYCEKKSKAIFLKIYRWSWKSINIEYQLCVTLIKNILLFVYQLLQHPIKNSTQLNLVKPFLYKKKFF